MKKLSLFLFAGVWFASFPGSAFAGYAQCMKDCCTIYDGSDWCVMSSMKKICVNSCTPKKPKSPVEPQERPYTGPQEPQ